MSVEERLMATIAELQKQMANRAPQQDTSKLEQDAEALRSEQKRLQMALDGAEDEISRLERQLREPELNQDDS